MADEDWIVFRGRSTVPRPQPQVSIHTRGAFQLNEAAFEALGKPKAVELVWNSAKRRFGFRAVELGTPHSYPTRPGEKGKSVRISGKAFALQFGIPLDRVRRYNAQMVGDVLAVDLDQDATEPDQGTAEAGSAGARANEPVHSAG